MRSIEPIAKFDLAFSLFCLQHKFCLPISKVSRLVSKTGDGHLYLVLGGMAWWFGDTDGKRFLAMGILAFALQLPIYWLTKNLFKRRRPQELSSLIPSFITPSDRYSLPSGHTAAAFLMAMLILQFYPMFGIVSFIWAGLIALSRILLGVHFLTDVVLGALLGLACSVAAMEWLGVG